ncbi:MAG: class I SAM-dependent methyltransferase [Pirellulaceae bacterium]|nr:class I SAM-dependent methyltransferase [Pirellulaceae bacterium]
MDSYALIDFGDGRKLERFGSVVLDRVSPAAIDTQRINADWSEADLRLDERGEVLSGSLKVGNWTVEIADIRFKLRVTPFGHVGVFPEQLANWRWLQSLRNDRSEHVSPRLALNLFAYTGGSTLALAQAGFQVVHVDASAPSVKWARENASSNGLDEHPVRWIVEDARKFTAREVKRKRRYDLIVLDPPSFGHGPGGHRWEIEHDLFPLLENCLGILHEGGKILLTAHSVTPSPEEIVAWLAPQLRDSGRVHSKRLSIPDRSHRQLDCGFCVRVET